LSSKRLKEVYGDKDSYLTLAVDNKKILTGAFEKQVEADPDKQKDLATYLDFIDLKGSSNRPKIGPTSRIISTFNCRMSMQIESTWIG